MKPVHMRCSAEEQVQMWVDGKSVHRDFGPGGHPVLGPKETYECCPDFSCCKPKLLWPKADRLKYQAAGQAEREQMLFGSLVTLTESTFGKGHVHVVRPRRK